IRRDNQRHEVLVRLMGNIATEKEPEKKDGQPAPGPAPGPAPVTPKATGEAAKLFKAKKGYANWYFNELERDKLLAEFRKHGDFAALPGSWVAEGKYQRGDQTGDVRFEVTEGKDDADPLVNLRLNIDYKLSPLKEPDIGRQREPIGSGGLMMALYHYHRLLTIGAKGFEGEFAHGGPEPVYPYPADGTVPRALNAMRVDCAVLRTKHGSSDCKWYFSRKDATLLGCETYITRDADPCEVYFFDYRPVDGRELPHRIEVRYGDKRYAI